MRRQARPRPRLDCRTRRASPSRRRETIGGPEKPSSPIEERELPFVYILRCRDGSLYTGAAKDLQARVRKHEAGTASRYTRARRPVVLVWCRRVRTWSRALREEALIKRLRRHAKEALVAGGRRDA